MPSRPRRQDRLRLPDRYRFLAAALLLLGGLSFFCDAAPGRWHWSNPLPHGNNIADFAYHTNGHFIQVTDHGQLYASDSLTQWDSRETGTRRDLRGATFQRDRLLVSGERGLIVWSDDLQRFHTVDLGTEDWLECVAASPDLAVAVGDNAAIYTSINGVDWSRQTVGFTNWLRGVAWGGNVFAAVGEGGLIITSPNGVDWTQREASDGHTANLNRIAWTGNGFVVAGDEFNGSGTVIFGNASGSSWVRQTQSGATGDLFSAAAASPASRLVAGDREVRLASGVLVIFWTDQTAPPDGAPSATYTAAVSDGNQYLLGGRTGLTVNGVRVSPDPEQTLWVPFPSPPRHWLFDLTTATATVTNKEVSLVNGVPIYEDVATVDHPYVAVGDLGTILTSDGGVTWSLASTPDSSTNRVYLGVGGNTNGLVAVGSGGLVSFSPVSFLTLIGTNRLAEGTNQVDALVTNVFNTIGVEWVESSSPTNLDLLAACASDSLYVITGQLGYIATSSDGMNWTPQDSGTSLSLTGVESWSGGFVAVGEEGTILTSPDGIAWSAQTSGTTNWLFRVRSGPGQLIAVGSNGTILTSPDAVTWSIQGSGVSNALNDVRFAFDSWFAVGNQGTVLHSRNGVDWSRDDQLITGKSLYGVAGYGVQLVTAGIEGVILRTRLTPYLQPVEILKYPQNPEETTFLFRGELDQRFRLDQGTAVNTIVPGPVLTITDPDGLLFYEDPDTNGPPARVFVAPNDP
ncbi:MAG: hypothetical protein JNL10_18700 [Verrucomicrobiales bacterium]|nr:hypothetical protein [Verrucomicrobiales bacterium]